MNILQRREDCEPVKRSLLVFLFLSFGELFERLKDDCECSKIIKKSREKEKKNEARVRRVPV